MNSVLFNKVWWLLRGVAILSLLNLATGCSDEPPTTWEEAKNIKTRSSLDGVGFDVPLNYLFGEFAMNQYTWPTVSKEVREGRRRYAVDFVKLYALLPDLEPVSEKNLAVFKEPGWGRKVDAFITHPRSFEYYFKFTAPSRLERLPDSREIPGMLHYLDNVTQDEFYLSHDHAVPELTRIRCPYSTSGQFPYCEVETLYRHEAITGKNGENFSVSTPYYLNYSFARSYLPQWRDIDRKLKALYDHFAQSAKQATLTP